MSADLCVLPISTVQLRFPVAPLPSHISHGIAQAEISITTVVGSQLCVRRVIVSLLIDIIFR
jgi:hypothetical protein